MSRQSSSLYCTLLRGLDLNADISLVCPGRLLAGNDALLLIAGKPKHVHIIRREETKITPVSEYVHWSSL